MRFAVSFPDEVRYTVGEDFVRSASISPDGKRVVFTGNDQATGVARLYIRMIDSAKATPLAGAEEGTEPFWSPDSKSIGFYAGGKVKIARVEGDQVRELANAPAAGGASWNDQGQILISLQNPGPLMLIPAAGGTPKPITALEPGILITTGRSSLATASTFSTWCPAGPTRRTRCTWHHLPHRNGPCCLEGVPAFFYAPPDRIVYLRNGALHAQVLDVKRAALTGTPVALADNALPPISASRTGALDLPYRTDQAKSADLAQARWHRAGRSGASRLLHRSADFAGWKTAWRLRRGILPMATTMSRSWISAPRPCANSR